MMRTTQRMGVLQQPVRKDPSMPYHGRHKTRWPKVTAEPKSVEELLKEMKKSPAADANYRERSLKIHGLICAKCGREFELANKHLLTVHHKDGNHKNNPPDGSNWENLCIYCHDDEHSRGILGDYLTKG
jgi:5-methylcytosine-specific restriction endonuclease McrA